MTWYHQPKLMEVARAMPSWTVDPDGTHGEVFTRRWVVDLILDLAGYRAVEDLGASVIVEPACGTGAFLVPIVERLAESCTRHGRSLADSGPGNQGVRCACPECRHSSGVRSHPACRMSANRPTSQRASVRSGSPRGIFCWAPGPTAHCKPTSWSGTRHM